MMTHGDSLVVQGALYPLLLVLPFLLIILKPAGFTSCLTPLPARWPHHQLYCYRFLADPSHHQRVPANEEEKGNLRGFFRPQGLSEFLFLSLLSFGCQTIKAHVVL